jgi:hypothetical protein
MNVVNIRFISGENCIADLVEEKNDEITIKDVIVAMPLPEDPNKIGFAPWAPLQDPDVEELTVSKSVVMYITTPTPSLKEQYCSMFGKIVAPEKKLIL